MSFLSEGEVIWLQECIPYTFLEWVEVEVARIEERFKFLVIEETNMVWLGMADIVVGHWQVPKNIQNLPSISDTYWYMHIVNKDRVQYEKLSVL